MCITKYNSWESVEDKISIVFNCSILWASRGSAAKWFQFHVQLTRKVSEANVIFWIRLFVVNFLLAQLSDRCKNRFFILICKTLKDWHCQDHIMLPNSVQKFILKIFALDFICFSKSKCGINTSGGSALDYGTLFERFKRKRREKFWEKREIFQKSLIKLFLIKKERILRILRKLLNMREFERIENYRIC